MSIAPGRDASISLFFPVYNDEATVRQVTEKGMKVCREIVYAFEIIIVDDGSPDRSGEIADELAREHEAIRVIHHPRNLGYGAAVRYRTGGVSLRVDLLHRRRR